MVEQSRQKKLLHDISEALGVPVSSFFHRTDSIVRAPQSIQLQEALSALFCAFASTHDVKQRASCIATIQAETARLKQGRLCSGLSNDEGLRTSV